jgi:serine O-acetyltransferase
MIGANSVVIKSVAPRATVVGIPGRVVEDRRKPVIDLEHGKLPDPVNETIKHLLEEQARLEERIKRLEELGVSLVSPEERLEGVDDKQNIPRS